MPKKKTASRKKTAASAEIAREERVFLRIVAKLCGEDRKISAGKMMTSDGARYGTKFFAFFWRKGGGNSAVFRLGREFDPATIGVKDFKYLNPFKNKPPMKDWFVVGPAEHKKWERLARIALRTMKAGQK